MCGYADVLILDVQMCKFQMCKFRLYKLEYKESHMFSYWHNSNYLFFNHLQAAISQIETIKISPSNLHI